MNTKYLAPVALESTVLTHGLPYPQNLQLAREMEAIIRSCGAEPHTIAILAGELRAGLTDEELASLCTMQHLRKVSRRDLLVHQREGHTRPRRLLQPLQLQLHVGMVVGSLEDAVLLLEVEQRARADRDDESTFQAGGHRTMIASASGTMPGRPPALP